MKMIVLEAKTTKTGFHKNNSTLPVAVQAPNMMNVIGMLHTIPCINAQIEAFNDFPVAWKLICPPIVNA